MPMLSPRSQNAKVNTTADLTQPANCRCGERYCGRRTSAVRTGTVRSESVWRLDQWLIFRRRISSMATCVIASDTSMRASQSRTRGLQRVVLAKVRSMTHRRASLLALAEAGTMGWRVCEGSQSRPLPHRMKPVDSGLDWTAAPQHGLPFEPRADCPQSSNGSKVRVCTEVGLPPFLSNIAQTECLKSARSGPSPQKLGAMLYAVSPARGRR